MASYSNLDAFSLLLLVIVVFGLVVAVVIALVVIVFIEFGVRKDQFLNKYE